MTKFIGLNPSTMKFSTLLTFVILLFSINVFSQGNCNEEDLQYIGDNNEFVQQVASTCGQDCLFDADPEGCLVACMQLSVPLSDDCLGCFALQVECASSNCFIPCVFGTEADCAACIAANCLAGFNECAGIFDADGDGFFNISDCNDSNASINPDALEIWYDGVDQNCDGLNDYDQDGDGDQAVDYGGTDCDDTDPLTSGGAVAYYVDGDMDGYGDITNFTVSCLQPPGTTLDNTDCDDTDDTAFPGAPGTFSGVDNNCDGQILGDEIFDCPGDFNGDFAVNATDLLSFRIWMSR
jgi:hypothetical protein